MQPYFKMSAMLPAIRSVALSLPCLLPLALAAQTEAPAQQQERYLFELLRAGGWTMVPLALCLLAALYLLMYCWRETMPRRFLPARRLAEPAPALNTGTQTAPRTPDAATPPTNAAASPLQPAANAPSTLFDRALARGLSKIKGQSATADRAAAENAIGETLAHAEAEQLRWIGYLNMIAAIAPMIGLLGTVSGMIGAFGTISVGGMGRPEMLAGNIGEALVSTATGLAVGIPAMLCYHVLHNRLGLRMNETVSQLNDALDQQLPS